MTTKTDNNTATSTQTIKLHRVIKAPTERVYRAFLDADATVKWLPPNGFTCKVHEMNATVGGVFRMSFTNFSSGKSHSFGGTYLELKPGERLRYSDKFDDPNLPGEMITTIELKQVFCGTEMHITQEGIPSMIPAEACYVGWQESLILLAKLVEAEIPDEE
ncbi:polyketide cyclase [Phragmitibacter flavus]|uniref:Polyketide cyclase n=1 Tax=Phragmitibacter flavus TaxID=2576071 RepID=A0A5R8KBE2_9BACT|nr:SRPBCC family protein [Phragmitibacter flavus]TLD68869.1 polyketide cyclase [Phragmitibacter flavus]